MITVHQLEQHRSALTGHCYRMMGSAVDADDAVQETMVRAWRALDRFEERASLRTWLYRIATRVCLDALADRTRRARPVDLGPNSSVDEPLTVLPGTRFIEPIPDAQALPEESSPAELTSLRQSIRLAFVAALQHLPARQRAVLLLSEVLGWSATEVATALDMSVAAVNSALQRARATLNTLEPREPAPATLNQAQEALLERYVQAFERYDVDALTQLFREDASLSMPPYSLWLRGREAIAAWLLGRGAGCRGSRIVPTESASGWPAFAHYHPQAEGGGHYAWALIVLELTGEQVVAMTSFLDVQTLFPRFGLPLELPPESR